MNNTFIDKCHAKHEMRIPLKMRISRLIFYSLFWGHPDVLLDLSHFATLRYLPFYLQGQQNDH